MRVPHLTGPRAMLAAGLVAGLTYGATKAARPPAAPPHGISAVTAEHAGPADPPPGEPGDLVTRSMALDRLDVAADGHDVLVQADARVFDRRPGHAYVWTVRAFNAAGLVHERRYPESATRLLEGSTTAAPRFVDALELPRGDYQIEVELADLPPGFDLGRIPRGGDPRDSGITRLRRSRRVSLP